MLSTIKRNAKTLMILAAAASIAACGTQPKMEDAQPERIVSNWQYHVNDVAGADETALYSNKLADFALMIAESREQGEEQLIGVSLVSDTKGIQKRSDIVNGMTMKSETINTVTNGESARFGKFDLYATRHTVTGIQHSSISGVRLAGFLMRANVLPNNSGTRITLDGGIYFTADYKPNMFQGGSVYGDLLVKDGVVTGMLTLRNPNPDSAKPSTTLIF